MERAESEGSIRRDVDPALTSRLLFGMLNSIIEWYRPRRGLTAVDLADAFVKIAFDGLRSRPDAPLSPVPDPGQTGSPAGA